MHGSTEKPKTMKKTESSIQQSALIWLTNTYGLKHHMPRLIMFSIPNEAPMLLRSVLLNIGLSKSIVDKATALAVKMMRNIGFLSGASDTLVLMPNGKTLFVEFKTEEGSQSLEQKEFQSRCESLGHKYYLVRSLDQFKSIIQNELYTALKHNEKQ